MPDEQKPRHVDFLDEKHKVIPNATPRKIHVFSRVLFSLGIVSIIVLIAFGVSVITSGEQLSKTFGNLSLWGQMKHLVSSEDRLLQGESDDRINMLLLGIGGKDHDGPQLTDTIIVASVKPSTNQVAMISLPRDLVAPVEGHGWKKINTANAYGEAQQAGSGPLLAQKTVSGILSIPIHYYLRVDFDGFVKIVDDIGGIDVLVEHTLDDPFYPIKGKETATTSERYEHLYIQEGVQHMDGSTALKFVRSRQGKNGEGSDFARSKRQQNVMIAMRDTVLSFGVLSNPYLLNKIADTVSAHVVTNLQGWELLRFMDIAKTIDRTKVITHVFDDSPSSQLVAGFSDDGAFVLRPKSGDFSEMQIIAQDIFDPTQTNTAQPLHVDVRNGTNITGMAFNTAQTLKRRGYVVSGYGNAPTRDYQKTVLYPVNVGPDHTALLETLRTQTNGEIASSVPGWLTASTSPITSDTHVVVVLGLDQQ